MNRSRASRSRTIAVGRLTVGLVLASAMACTSYYEVPIEVPISAKLDVEKYNRILVASFTTQTNEGIDLDSETVRLLRNQLRMRSNLMVLDADIEPLGDFSEKTLEQTGMLAEFEKVEQQARSAGEEEISRQEWIDLEQDKLLEDSEYWKEVGEEYQNPLIVTGKLSFGSESRSGFSTSDRYVRDSFNRPTLVRSNVFEERTGFTLNAEFYFVDGETGRTIHRERFTEEVIYGRDEQTSALSSYFELMDRLIPNFLSILSPQTFRGTRVLLK
ncbi:MAG TPA: hypothetical protein VLK65_19570 [Vicinamibacteria bacterium]|nr:hypothetical protein [Vicinamibacteria bacterium]